MMTVTSSLGSVSQLGEVKVSPLSVPASIGETLIFKVSAHFPLLQSSTFDRPMNQSGEGTIAVKQDTFRLDSFEYNIESYIYL